MCKDLYNPQIFTLNFLAICDIVLDETLDVTMFCYTFQDESVKLEIELYTNLVTLKSMIINTAEKGEKVLAAIASKANFENSGITVDFEAILGSPLIIDNIELNIYSPHYQNKDGEWVPDEEVGYIIKDFRLINQKS